MSEHFLNTCPVCGNITKCRCSHCRRVRTHKLCTLCASKKENSFETSDQLSEETETTTAGYDIPMAPPGRIGMHDTSYEKWKPLPHDTINLYLPFLMKKLGFQYLASALLKVQDNKSIK